MCLHLQRRPERGRTRPYSSIGENADGFVLARLETGLVRADRIEVVGLVGIDPSLRSSSMNAFLHSHWAAKSDERTLQTPSGESVGHSWTAWVSPMSLSSAEWMWAGNQ